MNKIIYYIFIGGCASVIIIPLLVVLCVIVTILKFYYDTNHGNNYKGASHYYFEAMKEGNGPEAVFWAKKLFDIEKSQRDNYTHDLVGYALELNGEYEEALEVYENCLANQYYLHCPFNIERVKYKLGRKEEAFQGYCRYAGDCLIKYEEPLKGEWWNDRNRALGYIRSTITMEQDGFFMCLSPFLENKDFLDFMEEEYQKLGEPPEYAAAMELFRAIDEEIDEEHLPRSYASDRLDAMREKILAERAANKVTE